MFESDGNIQAYPDMALSFWPAIRFLCVCACTLIYKCMHARTRIANKNHSNNIQYRAYSHRDGFQGWTHIPLIRPTPTSATCSCKFLQDLAKFPQDLAKFTQNLTEIARIGKIFPQRVIFVKKVWKKLRKNLDNSEIFRTFVVSFKGKVKSEKWIICYRCRDGEVVDYHKIA